MILGYPFLREFNPQINWSKGKLQGGTVSLQSTKFQYLKRLFKQAEGALKQTGRLPRKLVAFLRHTNLAQEWSHLEEMKHTHMTMETIPSSSDVIGECSLRNSQSDSPQIETQTCQL